MSIKPMKYVLRALDRADVARYPNVLFTTKGQIVCTDKHRIHVVDASMVCSSEGVPTPGIAKDFAIPGVTIARKEFVGHSVAHIMARTADIPTVMIATPPDLQRAERFPKWEKATAMFASGKVVSSGEIDLQQILKMAKLHASALRREALAKAITEWQEKEDIRLSKYGKNPREAARNAKRQGFSPTAKPMLSDFPAVVTLSSKGLYLRTPDATQSAVALADHQWLLDCWTTWWPARLAACFNLKYLDDALRGHTACVLEVPQYKTQGSQLTDPIRIIPQAGLTAYVMPMRG